MSNLDGKEVNLTWEGRAICVTYNPSYYETVSIAHIQVYCDEALPITETGYRSHFLACGIVEEFQSPVDYVEKWIQEEAAKNKWLNSDAASPQLSLF